MIIGRAIHLSFERRHADENDVLRVRNIRHVPFHGKNWVQRRAQSSVLLFHPVIFGNTCLQLYKF